MSAAALARELGTSLPRVVRAIERLGLEVRQDNGRMALRTTDVGRLRDELGDSPPRIPGLTPTEVAVLAALARAPLGLTSARTVAERAGLSPTTASRAIKSLCSQGLVSVKRHTLPAGRARTFELIRVDYGSPRWQQLAGIIAGAHPRPRRRRTSTDSVPPRLRHLFWNTAPSQLDTEHAGGYIARRLLSVVPLMLMISLMVFSLTFVIPGDTADTLSARILVEEHRLYPKAIGLVLEAGWRLEGRRFVVEHQPR